MRQRVLFPALSHAWCRVYHWMTNGGLSTCRGKAPCCSVSDLHPFCQETQPDCSLWTLQYGPMGAQAAFLFD